MIDLKELVICPICQTLHKRKPLNKNEEARCVKCNASLYKNIKGIEYRLFAFSITVFIFFLLANIFSIVTINLSGFQSSLTILEAIIGLFEDGFIVVSIFSLMILVVYPFFVIFLIFLYSLFMLIGFKEAAKRVLIALQSVSRWSMLDIFFIAILVAMIKIFEYATIEFNLAFWALGVVVAFEFYVTKVIKIESLWDYLESG